MAKDGVARELKKIHSVLAGIQADIGGVKADLGGVKADLGGVKADLGGVKADLGGVKADLGGVKSDLGGVKADLGGVKADLGGVKADLGDMKSDIGGVKADIGVMKSDIGGLNYEVVEGFKRVDTELNAAKIRDEEMLGKIKLGYEAVQGLRESTNARFDEISKEHRDQTDLLKSVIVHVRRRVERVEARKPRRRS